MISPQFVKAGRAVFTVENNQHQHYTFKVQAKDDRFFISIRSGSQYSYIGMLVNDQCLITKKSHMNASSTPVRVFNWSMHVINGLKPLPTGYSIHHEGICGRCGKELTDPESIRTGFGPYCRSKL